MKLGKLALAPIAAAAAMAFGTPATANSLLFQGVTFETTNLGGGMLELSILNAVSGGTGNWANISFLRGLEFKFADPAIVTAATIAPLGNWTTTVEDGLAANTLGCGTGGTPGACFSSSPALALSDDMSWTFTFTGTDLNLDLPHLKVQFLNSLSDTSPAGSLLSQNIPAVPEPETYAMMLAGLGLLGFVARRRRQGLGNVVPA